jgi:hypothetical protein
MKKLLLLVLLFRFVVALELVYQDLLVFDSADGPRTVVALVFVFCL